MGAALVTGPSDQQAVVSDLLRAAGHDPMEAGGGAAGRPFDWYVQLAETGPDPAGTSPSSTKEIVDRVADIATVADRLSGRATVLLVTPGWDWRERNALRLLAEATLASSPAREAAVIVVGSMADVVATVAVGTGGGAAGGGGGSPSLAELEPERGYADWRDDMLSLADESERTYFGWRAGDGQPRVAVLAGSVMSPVRALSGCPLGWGPSQDASGLAAALLADTLGPESLCVACAGDLAGCAECHGSGLAPAIRPLATAFVAEVLAALPDGGFEMRVTDVLEWARRQSAVTPVPDVVRRPRLRPVPNLRRLAPTLV